MRNSIVILLSICFGLLSCTNPSAPKNMVSNNVPDTVGFFAARNLKGIAAFEIDETSVHKP